MSTIFSRTAHTLGCLTEAQGLLRENLQIARESGNRWGIGLGLEQLAANAQAMQDLQEARQLLLESVSIYGEVGDPWSLGRALNSLSRLALAQNDLTAAETFAVQALRTAKEVDYNLNTLAALTLLTQIHARQAKSRSALEMALFVMHHPASSHEAKLGLTQILEELQSQLPADQIQLACSRAEAMTLDAVARELLNT